MSLQRFHDAQNGSTGYEQAVLEIRAGRKTSHWIWYIFPQLKTLGYSSNAKFYGISDFNEACSYLQDPVLFKHYDHMVQLVEQQLQKIPLVTLMGGDTDARKLISSLTLFRAAAAYLNSTDQKKKHDFKGLEARCNRIFDLISNQSYYPCDTTLTVLRNTRKLADTKSGMKQKVSDSVIKNEYSVPHSHTTPSHAPIIEELAEYKKMRDNEWKFHFNFLGIVSALYFIQDLLLGTDHFNTKNREIKISAASKLQKIMDPTHPEIKPLTEAEKKALQNGRLGSIVNKHGGLEQLVLNAPVKHATDYSSDTGFKI